MKKFFTFMTIVAATLVAGCETHNENIPFTPQDAHYSGTITVDQNDGTIFSLDSIEVNADAGEIDGTVDLTVLKVKFAEAMPITLDMQINGIKAEEEAGGALNLSGNNIVPIAMGGEFPAYTITNLVGYLSPTEISLTFMCGSYPVSYSGTAPLTE